VAGLITGPSFWRLQEPVRVTASVSLATRLRLDAIAGARDLSRSSIINEAICLWIIREEQRLRRDQRNKIKRLWREADEWAPVSELLASAKQPLEE
jgi:predicted transcriptional regulator